MAFFRSNGLFATVRICRHRLSESWNERRFHVDTSGIIDMCELGFSEADYHDYMPVSYRSFRAVMKRVPLSGQDVFVDYGCGKGRVLLVAATYPVRRVVGIELSEALASEATRNLENARRRLKCADVEVRVGDATRMAVPDDATILHFFNPFGASALELVADEIEASVRRVPRAITILFANADHFEQVLKSRSWVASQEDVLWPDFPRDTGPDSNRYRIYGVVSVAGAPDDAVAVSG